MSIYTNHFNCAFPLKSCGSRHHEHKHSEPWVTEDLIRLSKTKKKLHKKKLNDASARNIYNYKESVKLLNKTRRLAKTDYYRNAFITNLYDIKSTWRILRTVISGKYKRSLPNIFHINGSDIDDPNVISNEFNKFFVNVGQTTSESVPKSSKQYSEYLAKAQRSQRSFFLNPTDPNELVQLCNRLKPKTSVGHDDISTKLMKDTIIGIAEPLSHIFNLSFIHGIVPSAMKTAKIVPIHKSGATNFFNNYTCIGQLTVYRLLRNY